MDSNLKLGNEDDIAEADKEMYQRLVGKLIYLSHPRPDITFAVSLVSQFMHCPREVHLQVTYRILHYLEGTPPGRGILYKRNGNTILEAYTDADYAGSITDRRSTLQGRLHLGYFAWPSLGGGPAPHDLCCCRGVHTAQSFSARA